MADRSLSNRLKHAWSVFTSSNTNNSASPQDYVSYGYGTSIRPDRPRLRRNSERSIIASIYNRIAIDVAAVPIKHVRVDENGRYQETIKSGLNECLSLSANLDQTGRELILDAVLSMFDEGYVAIVPVET